MSTCADGPGKVARVIVGIDDTPGGIAALRYAVGLTRSRAAQLIAVRCWAPGLPRHGGRRYGGSRYRMLVLSYPGTVARQTAGDVTLRVFRGAFGGVPGDVAVRVETPQGDPGATLVRLASADDDVLVVGTRPGHPLEKAVHGSVTAYCRRHSARTVVVVPPDGPPRARRLRTRESDAAEVAGATIRPA
jgi:nucleotide-binding universal stress UspA family protein